MLRYWVAGPALYAQRIMNMLSGASSSGVRVLIFHDVPDTQFEAFDDLLSYIGKHHGLISPGEAALELRAGRTRPGRPPCMITFDDGFQSNFRLAKDVLRRHDAKAVFFVCPGLIDLAQDAQPAKVLANVFQGNKVDETPPPLMTWRELTSLRDAGHEIGNHGLTHLRLSSLDGAAVRAEVHGAADLLEARMGELSAWYAFAFGDIDSISAEALAIIAERHALCRSGVRGLNGSAADGTSLFADQLDLTAPAAYRKLILEGGLDGRYRDARTRLRALAEA